MSAPRGSWLRRAYEFGVAGARPLVFRDLDLRNRPDHPEQRFNLTVEPGTVVAVIGDEDSGVGDLGSYTLGLRTPISGATEVFGTPVAELSYYDLLVFRRRLGYHPVGDGLLQNLTLRDNVALPLRYASDHRAREVEERVMRLVDRFRLRAVAALRPAQANEEDRRRTALARAVALDPELAVLEAPFDGLTGRAATDLLERVGGREDGLPRSVLITAQDLVPSVRRLLTRVVRVVDGAAVEEAP